MLVALPAVAQPPAIEYVSESHGVTNVSAASSRASFNKSVSSGKDRYLLVALAVGNPALDISSLSYDGAAMTRLGSQAGDTCRLGLFGLASPAPGSERELVATLSGNGQLAWAVFEFTGVDQSRSTGPYASRTGSNGQSSLTIEHADGVWLVLQSCRLDGSGTVQTDYAVTRTSGWTFPGGSPWAVGGIPLYPAGGAPDGGAADAPPRIDALAEVPVDGPTPSGDAPSDRAASSQDGAVSIASQDVDLEVGCACRTGARGGRPGATLLILLTGLAVRLRAGNRSRKPGTVPPMVGRSM
jgi:hypothetical protein